MFSVTKDWKEYRIHLGEFSTAIKVIANKSYIGCSADYRMTLWFNEEPSEEIKSQIDAIWDNLTEEGEAAKFKLDADRDAAVILAKESLLTADFADLIPAERKIWMGMTLMAEDKDALLQKYSQA